MSHSSSWRTCVRAAVFVLALTGAAAPALAQQVRVKTGPVPVMQWRNAGETVGSIDAGAILQVIERDGDWIWIVLPVDVFGTRRVGWIRMEAVEPTALKEGMTVLQLQPEAQLPGQGSHVPLTPRPGRRFAGPRWTVEGLGGATFGTELAPFYGAAFGFHLTPTIQVMVEGGRFDNIVSGELVATGDAHAANTEQLFLALTGRRVDVVPDTHVPAVYGSVGARMSLPVQGRTHPYVSASGGLASVKPDLHLMLGSQDITQSFVALQNLPEHRTRFMASFGAGVNLAVMQGIALDLGYRYARVFYSEGINVNRVHLGLAYVF